LRELIFKIRSSSPGEFHPQALTHRYVTVSRHTAPASLPLESSRSQAYAKETRFLPVSWLPIACCELTHPLRSSPITGPSTLLLDDPPLCPALVRSRLWGRHLRFSLNIRATGSHVPHKSLDQVHAISMPDAAQTINRLPLGLSWRSPSTPVLTPSLIFRHLINGSLVLISLIHT
jgi:hypothetical protein